MATVDEAMSRPLQPEVSGELKKAHPGALS